MLKNIVSVLFMFMVFNGVALAQPAAPVLISPQGQVATSQPQFIWQDQADATLYRLYVYDRGSRQRVHLQNHNRSDVCSGGTCSVTPDISLDFSANHRWYLKARSSDGYSKWSRLVFSYVNNLPQKVIALAPSRGIGVATPQFEWQSISGATEYQIYVRNNTTKVTMLNERYKSADTCLEARCKVVPAGLSIPASSRLHFMVRARNSGGWGAWSQRKYFYRQIGKLITVAPEGEINTASPEFEWQSISGATEYQVYIRNRTTNVTLLNGRYPVAGMCVSDKCELLPEGLVLPESDSLFFRIRARNNAAWGSWSTRRNFNYQASEPQANNDSVTIGNGDSIVINMLDNDTSSVEMDSSSVIPLLDPSHAEVFQIRADGTVLYTHDGGNSSIDSFAYRFYDVEGTPSNTGMVSISIGAPQNQRPQANNDSAIVNSGGSFLIDVVANDVDVDGTINNDSVAVARQPAIGTAVAVSGGILYSHSGTGNTDSFSYTVADDLGLVSLEAEVSIEIGVVENLPPTANNDQLSVAAGQSRSVDVLDNDTDGNGNIDAGTIVFVQQPVNGTVGILANNHVSYTHNGGSTTSDSFRYTVKDNDGAVSNEALVSVSVVTVGTGNLNAVHRDGQTFLTWEETSQTDGYHVYRHTSPVSPANLGAATRITGRWGPLDSNTSVNRFGGSHVPANFVIDDLATALSDDTGLFVYTTQPGDSITAYYAVTSVRDGTEITTSIKALTSPVNESVATPRDVLTVSVNGGKGRIYTQYMDYSSWNPTFNGYAYNYSVALPANYNPAKSYPLLIEPHAYSEQYKFVSESEYSWEVIQMFPHDPGGPLGAVHSWWYGYAADHNYKVDGAVPSGGIIENFTEQRLMRSIDEVLLNPDFNVDEKLIHAYGNSMGASGALSLGIRYGSIISGVFASQPMTNYASSPQFQSELQQAWGLQSDNLPIVNDGPHSEGIKSYGVGGLQNVGVWDWMNHQQQLVERRGDDFGYLMTFHGKQDFVIDWQTQGKPIVKALSDANTGFSAYHGGSSGHSWEGFVSVVSTLFGFGYDENFPWKYPLDLSFPAIQNASGSSSILPADQGNDSYNLNIEWATPQTPFGETIVDQSAKYGITVRSTEAEQTADITPRRTQQFSVNAGQSCEWTATNNNTGLIAGSGTVTGDVDSLVTAVGVPVTTGAGTRLVIDCS